MSANGNGGNGNGAEGAPRPSMEEALAALGAPVDRVDKLTHFIGQQLIDITKLFRAAHERMDLQQAQLEQLRALLPGQPANSGGEGEGGTTLQ